MDPISETPIFKNYFTLEYVISLVRKLKALAFQAYKSSFCAAGWSWNIGSINNSFFYEWDSIKDGSI